MVRPKASENARMAPIGEVKGAERCDEAAGGDADRLAPVEITQQDGEWEEGGGHREEMSAGERKERREERLTPLRPHAVGDRERPAHPGIEPMIGAEQDHREPQFRTPVGAHPWPAADSGRNTTVFRQAMAPDEGSDLTPKAPLPTESEVKPTDSRTNLSSSRRPRGGPGARRSRLRTRRRSPCPA